MQGCNVLWPWAWHWTGQPLLGASQRVAKGDEAFINVLRNVDGVPEEELKKFVDPLYMAQYYTDEGRKIARRIGFSVDWRREFTTVWPTFQKFVEWQYANLKEKGYVTKGTHPVVWCPKDKSPTGDHDRQSGEGVTPEEYTLIKYKLDEKTFLPAATFRPETIYGITSHGKTHVQRQRTHRQKLRKPHNPQAVSNFARLVCGHTNRHWRRL
jgi:leucyl-tRNA synthetase